MSTVSNSSRAGPKIGGTRWNRGAGLVAAILNFCSLPSSINVTQRQPMSSVSRQSGPWSKIWRQPLESRRNQLSFKSYFQFRFGGRHLESVVNNVGRHRCFHIQVVRGRKRCVAVGMTSLCNWKQVTSASRKYPIFPWMVPLVFHVSPGTGER